MEKLGTWLAIGAVVIGFFILAWLLFADPPPKKKQDKKK